MNNKMHSEETKAKMRAAALARLALKPMPTGKDHPRFGQKASIGTRLKLSASHMGKQAGKNHYFYGKRHSEETKQKISQSLKGYRHSDESRSVMAKSKLGILAGSKNPNYGKIPHSRSGSGWSGSYQGWHFRSLVELNYVVTILEPLHAIWQSAETITIPYVRNGLARTYRADFLVDGCRLIEVKPKFKWDDPVTQTKQMAAQSFCHSRGWQYELVSCKAMRHSVLAALILDGVVMLDHRSGKHYESFVEYVERKRARR